MATYESGGELNSAYLSRTAEAGVARNAFASRAYITGGWPESGLKGGTTVPFYSGAPPVITTTTAQVMALL